MGQNRAWVAHCLRPCINAPLRGVLYDVSIRATFPTEERLERNFETTGSLTIDKRVGDTPIEVADIADQVRHSSLQLGCSFKQPRAYCRFCLGL